MPEALITYFGQLAKVNCDGNCKKACGLNGRPKVQLSADEDDYAFLADDELGEAPADPGTYEGNDAKPESAAGFPNKWCVRECERCARSKPGECDLPLAIKSFSKRVYNLNWRNAVEKSRDEIPNVNELDEISGMTEAEFRAWAELAGERAQALSDILAKVFTPAVREET